MAASTFLTLVDLGAPDAKDADVIHAAYGGDEAVLAFPGPFTDPDVPRNVRVTYGAGWDGGDVTVVGTDQYGAAQQEVIAAGDGEVIVGEKIFATVTSASKELEGADPATASIGTGDTLGIVQDIAAAGVLFADGVAEAGTWDVDNDSVAPTTAPDGSVAFVIAVSVDRTDVADPGTSPNGSTTAPAGTILVVGQRDVWVNLDGATAWKLIG